MKHYIKEHPVHGRCLYLDNGVHELAVALDFGLRVVHFSLIGGENIFYEHPNDRTDFTTEDGWRIRGGHRMWLAPEGPHDYCPDNEPVEYELLDDGVRITQKPDPWLGVVKCFTLTFENGGVRAMHQIKNVTDKPITCALWAISAIIPGGVEHIDFARRDGGYDPWNSVNCWDYTSLGDPRAQYTRDGITLTHLPIDDRYKIGVSHPVSPVRYQVGELEFALHFTVDRGATYPDRNSSYEAYFNRYFLEMESLSPLYEIKPDETREHEEFWELKKLER